MHVTQGTYDVDPADLLQPALAGLAPLDLQVAAATGGALLPGDRVPPNARQADFLPYDQLLPRASVVVSNGGWGGVLACLAAGVPLVVAGGTLDKPEIARRVAGRAGRASTCAPVARALRRRPRGRRAGPRRAVVSDAGRRDRGVPGAARWGAGAAELVERLAATRARFTAPPARSGRAAVIIGGWLPSSACRAATRR